MRRLLPALALAGAVSLFAAVPLASAQYGGGSTSDGSSMGSSMGSGMGSSMGSGMGMGPGMGTGMGGPGMGMSSGMGMSGGMAPAMPSASAASGVATTQFTCALGQVVPFQVPVQGLDQTGRPYFFMTTGWYGPYDGFGYPIVTQMVGQYGGVPMQRQSQGYIPSPCPVPPGGAPLSAMGGSSVAGMSLGSMPMSSMPMSMGAASMGSMPMGMGAAGMSPMGPMAPGPMMPPSSGVPTSMGPSPLGPLAGPAAPALGGLASPLGY